MQRAALDDVVLPIPGHRYTPSQDYFRSDGWYVTRCTVCSIHTLIVLAQPPTDLQGIIQKEALYCAFGRCASRLKDSIPFDDWLQNTLLAEASSTNPMYVVSLLLAHRDLTKHASYPIIKRRIAWLIGKWVHDSCTSPNNPIIWRILIHLLQDRGPGTDAVVRLTAAIALGECVDVGASWYLDLRQHSSRHCL